jgi:uncharacterized protein (DUF305 family)
MHRPPVPTRAASTALLLSFALFAGPLACGGSRAASASAEPRPVPLLGPERARFDSLRYAYTEADIAFMSGMIHHHAQAIAMSELAPKNGASPAILRLTARIINAQSDEIRLMQGWLRDRAQPVPEPNPAGMPMDHGGGTHHMLMPGMLTPEQMAELRAARGEAFDQLFLRSMIVHHRGAVEMVKELLAAPGAAQDETIFKFAADVHVDQSTEIRRMMSMLLEMGGIPPA